MTNQLPRLIDDEDVIQFFEDSSPLDIMTGTVEEILEALNQQDDFLGADGVACRYLSATKGGWKKGTLRVCLAFIPEDEEPLGREDVRE